eukprot:gene7097-7310_t
MLSDAPAPGLNITILPELPADAYLEEVFGNVSTRDNYHKANLRHLKSVQWLGQQKQAALLDIDWVMMVDDDTFVNVPLLLQFLAQLPASLPMSFGMVIDSGPWDPFLKGVAFLQGGAGMLFTKQGFLQLAEHVLSPQCCDKKELLANDVAIGFALPRAKVVKVHSALFYPEEAANSYDVVIQDVGMRISQHRCNERCYKDDGPTRRLTLLATGLSPRACSDLAYQRNFTVFGVQYSDECWAGNNLTFDFGEHPGNWDFKYMYLYFRGNNSYKSISTFNHDAACGMWHRMPDGDFMGFSGFTDIDVRGTYRYHRHLADAEDMGVNSMPFPRWYGGTILLPDGRSYITGGDSFAQAPRALGADIWDPATKTYVGRYTSMGQNTPLLPLNSALFDASDFGGYYPGLWQMPSGGLLFGQSRTVQVINPLTGEALAAAPPLPVPLYFEYPMMGTQDLGAYITVLYCPMAKSSSWVVLKRVLEDWTPIRNEIFTPSYIMGARPAFAFVPTIAEYGSTFRVTMAVGTNIADIVSVVLMDPGSDTHSSTMAVRNQLLDFASGGGQDLLVTAPANTYLAPATFYLLFAVYRDDSYSTARWIKLKGPWASLPLSLPKQAKFVPGASTQAEGTTVPWFVSAVGSSTARLNVRVPEARGSGSYGLGLVAGNNQNIVLAGPTITLAAGTRMQLFLWARSAAVADDQKINIEFVLLNSANAIVGSNVDNYSLKKAVVGNSYQQYALGGLVPPSRGNYRPAVRVTGMTAGMQLHLDDLEVFTLTASDYVTAVALARNGTSLSLQINGAVTGRRLLQPDQKASESEMTAKGPRKTLLQAEAETSTLDGNATKQPTAFENSKNKEAQNGTQLPSADVLKTQATADDHPASFRTVNTSLPILQNTKTPQTRASGASTAKMTTSTTPAVTLQSSNQTTNGSLVLFTQNNSATIEGKVANKSGQPNPLFNATDDMSSYGTKATSNSTALMMEGDKQSSADAGKSAEAVPQDTSPAVMSWIGTLEMAPLPARDPKVQQDLKNRPRSTFGKMKRVNSLEHMRNVARGKAIGKKRKDP